MKTATQYLLYDEDCSLCRWYTRQFIRFNFLKSDELISYNQVIREKSYALDEERAKNEIALVDKETKEVTYGINSLLSVLGNRWKLIEVIGAWKPVNFLLEMLYKLVSFNRKVIAPVDCNKSGLCVPTYNRFWRITFILMSAFLVNFIVGNFFQVALSDHIRTYFPFMDMLLFLGQILFQWGMFRLFKQHDFLTYAGQIAVISIIGAVTLGVMQFGLGLMASWGFDVELLYNAGYGIVIGIMLLEHTRRIKILGHTKWLTVTWMLYRILIYPIVFEL